MFKNNIFNASVDTRKWVKAPAVRCVRTFASTVVALMPTTAMTLGSVDWGLTFSSAATATVVILFTCVAGIPEVEG